MVDDVRELVRRCLAGEAEAIAALIDRYHGRVFGVCYRMLGHRQDAEDMAQETFVRAIRGLRTWDPTREFTPWLVSIAGNRCRTLLGARRNRPQAQPLPELIPDDAPDEQAVGRLAEEVTLALRHVRDEYRQAFLLFHEQELSYAEIAAALGCPLGTVKTWVHRAQRELIRQLQQRGVTLEDRHAVR